MENKKREYLNQIIERLDEFTNELTKEIMEKENINKGDITPSQVFDLEENFQNIAKILLEVVEQNKNVD